MSYNLASRDGDGEEREIGGGAKMVGMAYDCLANPLGAVRVSFEKAAAASGGFDPAAFDRKDWGAVDLFRAFLFEDGGLSQVPYLVSSDLHLIRPNSLVRFRGMVQDMLGNELYIGAFKDGSTWKTNKYTDVASVPIGSTSQTQLWERRLLYCTPVPGQNSWVLQSDSLPRVAAVEELHHGEKRRRDVDNGGIDFSDFEHTRGESPSSNKKQKEGEFSCNSLDEMGVQMVHPVRSSVLDSLPCLVKMYNTPEDDIKLNDVVEFIGVYTFDPELAIYVSDELSFDFDLVDDALANLPPSKVPRLHCLICKQMTHQDFIPRSCLDERLHNMKSVRDTLLGHLTAVLGNDGLAAQFILLHLLSRVRFRVDVSVVGKLSLNLIGFNRESATIFGDGLACSIKGLVPFSQAIPLSVEYLNTSKLQPSKDNKTGRLMTGILQLPQGTHLTVDETLLNAGTLNSSGVENTMMLRQLMELQTVGYDCEYYKLDMAADVQVLILSERKSNILPADLVLPFHPTDVNTNVHPTEEQLNGWRWYLATLRCLTHSIEPQIQKVLEDDFVAARQEDKSLKTEDLSRWLTMGQLMSASFGETRLSLEHWHMVKELERLRKERLR